MNHSLTIGIGNGSLFSSVCWMLARTGIVADPSERMAWQDTGNELVSSIFASRPQHLVAMLRLGNISCVIMGEDMLKEHSERPQEFSVLARVPLGKTSRQRNTRVVAFVPCNATDNAVASLNGCQILSEYPALTQQWLIDHGISAEIVSSSGSTESMVATGVYACGVGVTETGASLATNNLRVIDTLMDAPVVCAVRHADAHNEQLQNLTALLQGVHVAQEYVLIKMNVAKTNVTTVVACLPSLKSPTVHELYDGENVAIETVIKKNHVATAIHELLCAGASGIIYHAIDAIIL